MKTEKNDIKGFSLSAGEGRTITTYFLSNKQLAEVQGRVLREDVVLVVGDKELGEKIELFVVKDGKPVQATPEQVAELQVKQILGMR